MIPKKVTTGERIKPSAATWNAMVDAATFAKNHQPRGGNGGQSLYQSGGIIEVLNDSGSNIQANTPMGVTGPLFTHAQNEDENRLRPAFRATATYDKAWTDKGSWVITAEPIPNGTIGKAWCYGVASAAVNVYDEKHLFADIDGSGSLRSYATGRASILSRDSAGTGVKWCMLQLGARKPMAQRCNCFLKEAMIPGNSTKTVYHVVVLDGGISPLNDPDSITEELPNVANTFAWSGDIDAPCKIEWNATLEQWEFYQVKCPA